MKKLFSLLGLLLLTLSSAAQEKYFHDLKGIEDSTGTTHLFYRIFEAGYSDETGDFHDYTDHIYHFDTHAILDSVFLTSKREYSYFYGAYNLSGPYLFLDGNIKNYFNVNFKDDEWGNNYNYLRGFNGSFFDTGQNTINAVSQIRTDSSKILTLNLDTKSVLVILNSDSLPSIHYPYSRLVKASDPEEYCFSIPEEPCVLGASDSVLIYDFNNLRFKTQTDTIAFFQRNDSLFYSHDLGKTMVLNNTELPWSKITEIEQISDTGHLLAQTDSRRFFVDQEHNPDSSSVFISNEARDEWTSIFSDTNRVYTASVYNNHIVFIGSGHNIYIWDSPKPLSVFVETEYEISGLYYKTGTEILYALTTEELLEININTKSVTILKTLPTSNEPEPTDIPNKVELYQNYPNPFNPVTVISYQLPVNSAVSLKVFDLLGREVAVLVDGRMSAGTHEVSFDARGLSSGMYFYRLEANGEVLTKRLTLIK